MAVFNRDMTQGAGMPCETFADTYVESMRIVAQRIGLDPDRTSGMGTAAQMENVSVQSRSYKELTVTALVTGAWRRTADALATRHLITRRYRRNVGRSTSFS